MSTWFDAIHAEEILALNRPSDSSDRISFGFDAESDHELQSSTHLGAGKEVAPVGAQKWFEWRPWHLRGRRRKNGSIFAHLPFCFGRRRLSIQSRAFQVLLLAPWILVLLVILVGVYLPSYTDPPDHYLELRRLVDSEDALGRGNANNEKVFIAASIYEKNAEMLTGHWGDTVRELVDILGPDNVFLSIYENDPDERTSRAMERFPGLVSCNTSIFHEHLDLEQLPHSIMSDGSSKLKRITMLAEVRNRALRPLEDPRSPAYTSRFDKLLYLNDIAFNPVDAANLLFSTNLNSGTREPEYLAACAVDFINPFKFYDTFATRDTEGYQVGVPFYPWFTASGSRESRSDVLGQKDAARVKSCWGGMVAFEAKWFQPHVHLSTPALAAGRTIPGSTGNSTNALRFRAEPDTYWDASECCLIHADLAALSTPLDARPAIYMNPYIRVAYTTTTLRWLAFTRRFERLYPWMHHFVNVLVQLPQYNPRQTQQPGDRVLDRSWVWDAESVKALREGTAEDWLEGLHGDFQVVERTATPGQFCGDRHLRFMEEHPGDGGRTWESREGPSKAAVGL